MKPVYLEMKYFGPHEDSIIDFRQLEEAPIFLIGGDTGAGKSTIFDAMTFALFGSTTGDRSPKELRSQFAPADEKTEVIFYFEQGSQLYRIVRTPEQYLTKKRGTGLARKLAQAKLAIVDQVGGMEISSIASKPPDVGNEINEILNLSADQFKKIILLPQNDFSEFLKSKTDQKEAILKKIFGTQLFSDFTSELKTKYDEAKKHSENFETKLSMQLESSVWSDEEKQALSEQVDEQKVVLLKQFVEQRQTKLAESTAEQNKINQAVKAANQDFQAAQKLNNKFSDLNKFKTAYQQEIVDQEDEFAQQKLHLAELQWAKPLQDPVRDQQNKQVEYDQNLANQTTLTKNVTDSKAKYQADQEKVAQLTAKKDDFDSKSQRIKVLNSLIPQVAAIEELQRKIADSEPKLQTLQDSYNEKNQTVKSLAEQIESLKKDLVSVDDLQQQRNDLTKQKETFVDSLTPLDNQLTTANKEVKQSETQVSDLKSKLTMAETQLKDAQAEYDHQKSRRQDLMIAQLQKELVDGEPCVVCGSTDHSNMVHTIEADESELKEAMEQVDKSQNNLASVKNSVETIQKDLKTATTEWTNKQSQQADIQQTLTNKYQTLTNDSKLAFSTDFSLSEVKSVFDQKISSVDNELEQANLVNNQIKDLETKQQTANNEVNQINLQLTSQKSAITSNKTELDQKSKDVDLTKSSNDLSSERTDLEQQVEQYQNTVQSAQKALQDSNLAYSNNQTKLTDIKQRLQTQKTQLDSLKEQLSQALQASEAKTNDMDVLKNWISEINTDKLSKLQVAIANYQHEQARLKKEIEQLETELKDAQKPELSVLQTKLDQLDQQKETIISQTTYAKKVLDDAQESLQQVESILKNQGQFAKKLGEVTSLYNIVTGKDGNDNKLKLETYVVQNCLQRVLNYANEHFINLLSNNRYTFELSSEASDRRTDHGLDINVFDNETGDSRSSDTLSGGETFIAALSIALSLSVVVQSSSNGVQIDALFVDEGFGSLDHETLNKAMTALETIGENRMVGVISHIESMTNDIGQQVYIKKLGDGRSTVKMISK